MKARLCQKAEALEDSAIAKLLRVRDQEITAAFRVWGTESGHDGLLVRSARPTETHLDLSKVGVSQTRGAASGHLNH